MDRNAACDGAALSHRILCVDWVDTASTYRWRDRREAAKKIGTMRCQSVGLVIRDDKESIVLAQSWSADLVEVTETIAIPRNAILKRRRLGTISKKK